MSTQSKNSCLLPFAEVHFVEGISLSPLQHIELKLKQIPTTTRETKLLISKY